MTTTKSYLAGLGMTGIVIGSVLVLLAVGTGLVAFDGARDVVGGRAPLERVVVGNDSHSAHGERAPRRPDAPPAHAIAAGPPVAASQPAPQSARVPVVTGRHDSQRPRPGHGGAQARVRTSLGGGAPARDASVDGGGVAADGPLGRAKRGAGAPAGHAKARAPISAQGRLHERVKRGRGHAKARAGSAVGGGALGGPPGEPRGRSPFGDGP